MNKVKNIHPKASILFIPTCVDYDKFPRKIFTQKETLSFGWIGGNNNQKYLNILINDMNEFHKQNNCELIIISGKKYINPKARFPIKNIKWSIETQINDLYKIDIGLMPLPINSITKGKCGFKAIQYMGLGIPCIATKLTANKDIIDHGENGFLVSENNNWLKEFEKIGNVKLNDLGKSARLKIDNNYTFNANFTKLNNFLLEE